MDDILKKVVLGMVLGCIIVSTGAACKEAIDAVVEYRRVHKETLQKEEELKFMKAYYGIND